MTSVVLQQEVCKNGLVSRLPDDEDWRLRLFSLADAFNVSNDHVLEMVSGSNFNRYFILLDGPTTRTFQIVRLRFLEDNFCLDLASAAHIVQVAHA